MSQTSLGVNRKKSVAGDSQRTGKLLESGAVLENRYEIQKIIGRGGMSTVYSARDLRFSQVERLCAIKEMFDHDPDPGTRALRLVNFEREAALLATISHQSVPRIYDYFSYGGLVYLVLEYIDGQDLERLLATRQKPYYEKDVVPWALEICSVLRMLHNYEPDPIIFRDLKPSNIMLRSSGNMTLIDFGIARMFQGAQRGTMIGTEGYAPPEQYRGIADARGDIYALGATLHHLVTNSDPRHETPFTFHERPVQSFNPDVSDRFANIVSQMLMYHPDQRLQSVDDVEAQLSELLFDLEHAETQNQDTMLQSSEQSPSSPQTMVFSGTIQAGSRQFERTRSSRKRIRRRKAQDEYADRIAWRVQTGDEVRGSAIWCCPSVLIGSYDSYVYSIDPSDGVVNWKFPTGRGVVSRPVVAEDLAIICSEDASIYGVGFQNGMLRWTARTGAAVRSSPVVIDGVAIVGSDDSSVYAIDCLTGDVRWRQRAWGAVRSSPAFPTGNSKQFYIGSDDTYTYAIESASGEILWKSPSAGPVQVIPAVGDGQVIVASRRGVVTCYADQSGKRLWQTDLKNAIISSPQKQHDVVVQGLTDGALVGLSTSDGSELWRTRYANQISSSPLLGMSYGYVGTVDGDCLAFSIDDGDLLWKHTLGGPIVSSPAYAGATIVLGSLDGNIYGIKLNGEEIEDLTKGHVENGN